MKDYNEFLARFVAAKTEITALRDYAAQHATDWEEGLTDAIGILDGLDALIPQGAKTQS